MSTIKVDNIQTTAGVGVFTQKVWVNFNGVGVVSIRNDGNVSSITDRATGRYTVNFSSSLTSSDYATTADKADSYQAPDVGVYNVASSGPGSTSFAY